MVLPFLRWLASQDVQRLDALDVSQVRVYRSAVCFSAGTPRPPAAAEDHPGVAPRHPDLSALKSRAAFSIWRRHECLRKSAPSITSLRYVACWPYVSRRFPTEDLVVRLLVGSGLRRAGLWLGLGGA